MGRAETPGLGRATSKPRLLPPGMRAQARWHAPQPRPAAGVVGTAGRGNGRRLEAPPPPGPRGAEASDGRCAPSP